MLEGIHIACQASLSHGRLPTWWDADHAATLSVSADQRGVTHELGVFRSEAPSRVRCCEVGQSSQC